MANPPIPVSRFFMFDCLRLAQRWRCLILLSFVLTLSGCVVPGDVVSPPNDIEQAMKIEITHLGSSWRVQITLPQPSQRYVFKNTPQLAMRKDWSVVERGLSMVREGKRDVVESDVAFTDFTLLVPANSQTFQGGYALTQTYPDDEGWMLYTGHFLGGAPQTCAEGSQRQPPCATELPVDYVVHPAEGEHLWLGDEIIESSHAWYADEYHDAFIYFGTLVPETTAGVSWLVPTAFPEWIKVLLRDALPGFMDRMTEGYGQSVDTRLKLVLNQAPGGGSFTAGVLRDFIQFELQGEQWLTPNERSEYQLLEILAHEAAHLWNGNLYQHDHALGHNWLHEGGATAAASILTRERMGSLEGFFAERTTQLNSCLTFANGPLKALGANGHYQAYYTCGAIIEMVIEGALREKGLDPFIHWRKMYEGLEDLEYDLDQYIEAVVQTTQRPDVGEWIRAWTEQGLPDTHQVLNMLRSVGVQLRERPAAGNVMAGIELVRPLLKEDCQGGFSISLRGGNLVVHERKHCTLTKGNFLVTGIAGFSLPEQVDQAFDAMIEGCGSDSIVVVQGFVVDGMADQSAGDNSERTYPCSMPPTYNLISGWSLP